MKKFAIALCAAVSLCACSGTTTIRSVSSTDSVKIRKTTETTTPRTEEISTTSFGNYDFKVMTADNKTMYGLLPLRFNGGYLAPDILFFAPGLFFNLRGVYKIYEFDAPNGVVKYKNHESDPWMEYKPSDAEASRAKMYFEKQ